MRRMGLPASPPLHPARKAAPLTDFFYVYTTRRSTTKNFKKTGVLRNIKSAANHRSVKTTGNIAAKGIQNIAKWIATDHLETDQRSNIMALEQDLNFIIAKWHL